MCRFVAFLGSEPVLLDSILEKPQYSLIHQSRKARETETGLNADGFGLGWYDHSVDDTPAVFKSVLPAWNDRNLNHLAAKIRAKCFIGHVRASTVGDVILANCHPFISRELLFAHNGTIHGFDGMKRRVLETIEDEYFFKIKGNTDSEYFFSLLASNLYAQENPFELRCMRDVFESTIKQVVGWQRELSPGCVAFINAALTNGREMIVCRYINVEEKEPLSLYYSIDDGAFGKSVLVASERLTDVFDAWKQIPANHFLLVDKDQQVEVSAINVP